MNPIGFPGQIGSFWGGKLGEKCNHIIWHVTSHDTKKGLRGRHNPLLLPCLSFKPMDFHGVSTLLAQVLPSITLAHSQDIIIGLRHGTLLRTDWTRHQEQQLQALFTSRKVYFMPGIMQIAKVSSFLMELLGFFSFCTVCFSLDLIKALSWDQRHSGGRWKGSNCLKVQQQTKVSINESHWWIP